MSEIGGMTVAERSAELRETKEMKRPGVEGFKNIKPEEGTTPREAKSFWKEELSKEAANPGGKDNEVKNTRVEQGLTAEEKSKIEEETGWSDKIISYIESMAQYKIYKEVDLHEVIVNGRECLVKNIDLDYVDPKTGMTNSERMAKGLSAIDSKTGEKITLHHMKQEFDAPFAELCENSEHGDGNDAVLHPRQGESWRKDPEKKKEYQGQREAHWRSRAEGMK